MAKIIFKIPYMKANSKSGGWIKYIATRKGVDKSVNRSVKVMNPTKKQLDYIDELLKNCPDVKDTYEYQDYLENPTRQNASAFISVASDIDPELFENREGYINYISTRPNVEKHGEHGLFGNDDVIKLSEVKDEVSDYRGVIWMPIISLRREDAARLGYDNADAWRDLLRSKQIEISEIFGIPLKDFKWYASFHNEGHHPHCHMVIYSPDCTRGFITKDGIKQFKSLLANEIFTNDMYELYDEKTKHRNRISEESKDKLKDLTQKIREKDYSDSPICDMLLDLSQKLKTVKGKKSYGYLPKLLKNDVDNIVKAMSEDTDIQNLYAQWCAIQKRIVEIYNDNDVEFPALWENKDFKKIKNAVIREADMLDVDRNFFAFNGEENNDSSSDTDLSDGTDSNDGADKEDYIDKETTEKRDNEPYKRRVSLFGSVFQLFCRLANIIVNDANKKIDGHNKTIVDSKERKELAKKKQRLGIKME